MRRLLLTFLLSLAVPAAAGPMQDAYNAAQAAFDAGRNEEAAQGFTALLARLPKADQPGNRTAALIRARLGAAYLRTNDAEAAASELERAVADLPSSNAGERIEHDAAEQDYALSLALTGRRQDALTAFRRVLVSKLALNDEASVVGLRIAIARLTLFSDPVTAQHELDLAIPVAERLLVGFRDQLGDLYSLRGRVELNHGNLPLARDWFSKALKTAGGLGMKVSLADTRIRSDLGIASYLLGDRKSAYKYFAYTGAGHLKDSSVMRGADTPLPVCGAASGVEPADTVILEFSIGSDGRTIAPTTIYSSRPGAIDEAFERAVADWSWSLSSVANLDDFWRNSVRLQLRCSTAAKRGDLASSFVSAFNRWLAEQKLQQVAAARSDAEALPRLRDALRHSLQSGNDTAQSIPILAALSNNSMVSADETGEILDRLLVLLVNRQAPADVVAPYQIHRFSIPPAVKRRQRTVLVPQNLTDQVVALSRTKTRGAGFALITLGMGMEGGGNLKGAEDLYREAIAIPLNIMPDADPVRQVALLRIASLAAARKEIELAKASLNATGLSPDQCALVDVQPTKLSGKMSIRDFPDLAREWGFDGFAQVAYDIDPAGKPVNVRAVVAYPPFVFADATEQGVRRFTYQPIFRDGATVGCEGMTFRQAFRYQEQPD